MSIHQFLGESREPLDDWKTLREVLEASPETVQWLKSIDKYEINEAAELSWMYFHTHRGLNTQESNEKHGIYDPDLKDFNEEDLQEVAKGTVLWSIYHMADEEDRDSKDFWTSKVIFDCSSFMDGWSEAGSIIYDFAEQCKKAIDKN